MSEPTSQEQLKSFTDRIMRLEEDKAAVSEDIRDIYQEAKSQGLDVKILRQIVKLLKMEEHDRKEQEELLDIYKSALGME